MKEKLLPTTFLVCILFGMNTVFANSNEPLSMTPYENDSYDSFVAKKKYSSSKRRGSSKKKGKKSGNPFKLDITAGLALGDGSIGFTAGIEPKYNIMEPLALGLEVDYTWLSVTEKVDFGIGNFEATGGVSIISFLPSVEYMFLTDKIFRPYVGLGIGGYYISSMSMSVSSSFDLSGGDFNWDDLSGETYSNRKNKGLYTKEDVDPFPDMTIEGTSGAIGFKFGLAPKIGFEISRFRLDLAYNIIFGMKEDEPSMNFFSAKIGVFLWGKP